MREVLAAGRATREIEVPEVIGSPRLFGYRNQAKLVVRRGSRGLRLGIYRPGTHEVVDIRHCPIHHPLIAEALPRIASLLEEYEVSSYDERSRQGDLRYLLVRASSWTRSLQVILVTATARVPGGAGLVRALHRLPRVTSVMQNINSDPGNVILAAEFRSLAGRNELVERIGDLKLMTRAGAFLQANIQVARRLYEQAVREATILPASRVLDLYCGAGALAFHLAREAALVVGLEESPIAVIDAKMNVRRNGFHNVRFHAGTVEEALPTLLEQYGTFDVVTLNPPRRGADEATLQRVAALAPRRIVYVSCLPRSLARDLDRLADLGYRTVAVQPYDLLPQTEHVECVATLEPEVCATPALGSPS